MPFKLGRPHGSDANASQIEAIRAALGERSIVLIGLMGAGKSSVGRRLARRLGLRFADADCEIEKAAGQSISDIFAEHGEAYFRDGERRVIARMLGEGPQILATGGGAYLNEETRNLVAACGIAVWLKADLDLLMKRVSRRNNRPLLRTEDPRAVMDRLIAERYPVYAEADLTIESRDVPHDVIVGEIIAALAADLAPGAQADHTGPPGDPRG